MSLALKFSKHKFINTLFLSLPLVAFGFISIIYFQSRLVQIIPTFPVDASCGSCSGSCPVNGAYLNGCCSTDPGTRCRCLDGIWQEVLSSSCDSGGGSGGGSGSGDDGSPPPVPPPECSDECGTAYDANGNNVIEPGEVSFDDPSVCGSLTCAGWQEVPANSNEFHKNCWGSACDDPPPSCNDQCQPLCDPVNCPAGSSATYTGDLCFTGQRESCNCVDGCGNTDTVYGLNCYYPETNVAIASPSSISMNIAGFNRTLGSFTLIPRPLAGETAQISVPPTTAPGARALKYPFAVNTMIDGTVTDPWRNLNYPVSEDYWSNNPCDTSATGTNNVTDYIPGNVTLQNALQPGYIGYVMANYMTLNQCQNSCQFTPNTVASYRVDTYPTYSSMNITSNGSYLNCSNTQYTSTRINNPLPISVTVTDVDGAANIETIAVWFSQGSPNSAIRDLVVDSTPPNSPNGTQFGFMVEKARYTDNWTYIFVPRFTAPTTWRWWRHSDSTGPNAYTIANSNSASSTIYIRGTSGNRMIRISDVAVTENGNNATLTANLTFYNSVNAGGLPYDPLSDGTYNVNVATGDEFFFSTSNTLTMRVVPTWTDTNIDWRFDMTRPTLVVNPITITGPNNIRAVWSANDPNPSTRSGLKGVFGDASFAPPTPGFTLSPDGLGGNYDFTPATTFYNGSNPVLDHLWVRSSGFTYPTSANQNFVLNGATQSGTLTLFGGAFDMACNTSDGITSTGTVCAADGSCQNTSLYTPWMITRGGSIFSQDGTEIPVQSPVGSGYLTADPNLWLDPFRVMINTAPNPPSYDVALGTAYIGSGTQKFESTPGFGFGLRSYNDLNDRQGGYYTELLNAYNLMKSSPDYLSYERAYPATINTNRSVSQEHPTCGAGSNCVFINAAATNLTINSNFTCDRSAVFFVNGNLTINPPFRKGAGATDGCIFVVSGTITVNPGSYQTVVPACTADPLSPNCYPNYDLVEGFFVANGVSTLAADPRNVSPFINEGLLIRGSLLSFGGDPLVSTDASIVSRRSLNLLNGHNLRYPAVVFHHDPRYLMMSRQFFAINALQSSYKTDIGFKPL